jgi:hypothetical protein
MNELGIGVVVSSILFIAACGGGGGDAGSGGGGGSSDTGPDSISFSVRLVDATAATDTPLEGIEVSAAEHPEVECATSDADGKLTMTLPAGSELMLRCENDAYGPMYMTWAIDSEDIEAGTFSLLEKGKLALFVSLSGGKEWPDKGAITANVYDDLVKRTTRVPGATFTIEPASGGGPTYVGAGKLPDKSLTASSEGGPALFFDLDEGEVTITIAHPERVCTGGFGWKTDDDKTLRSRIFPGGLSNVTFVCPP